MKGYITVVLMLAGLLLVGPVFARLPIDGFIEPALGIRYDNDGPVETRNVLRETRLMLEHRWYGRGGEAATLKVLASQGSDEEADVEVREASLFIPLGTDYELNVGRQVLSWGPARFEFVNDNFAKDYRSFFLGRDMEFLKAPNDALRLSRYGDWFNIDLALMPSFEADRTPRGQVLPVYHPGDTELVTGEDMPGLIEPEKDPANGEAHLRLHRMVGSWEAALYGYRGFTGTPVGWNMGDSQSYYPEMASGGFSLRGPVAGMIVWLEGAYQDIREPLAGDTTNLPVDQYILMAGLEYQPSPQTTYMLQGTWQIQDDASTRRQLFDDDDHPHAQRNSYRLQVAAGRDFMADRLNLEARGFIGITEEDWQLRLQGSYEWSDAVNIYFGSLHFDAEYDNTRFGPVQDNDLIYSRLRYSF